MPPGSVSLLVRQNAAGCVFDVRATPALSVQDSEGYGLGCRVKYILCWNVIDRDGNGAAKTPFPAQSYIVSLHQFFPWFIRGRPVRLISNSVNCQLLELVKHHIVELRGYQSPISA